MSQTHLNIIRKGLPKTSRPASVIVVGAGMAGLAAAYELKRAGHTVSLLEAQGRVGGRVLTLREPFSDGLYAEAGAMRIPKSHDLTMAYIEKFKLATLPFTMGNPEAYYYLHGQRYRIRTALANPDILGFETAAHERGQSHSALWEAALQPLLAKLKTDREAGWAEILRDYDDCSTREFLEGSGWSEGAIEMFGLLADQEALMNASFLELFREEAGHFYTDMLQLKGGMDHLPRAFLPELRHEIRFGAKMTAIEQNADSVTIRYQTRAGRASATADYAILTVPFPVLRHVEVLQPFTRNKQRAIRQLHYDASAKILIQSRTRFWETEEGIFGGGSVTDLPIRILFYPEHGQETGRGVLLASYTWAEDAQRWGSLSPTDRITQAVENLTQIHPQMADNFEVGASYMWHDDEFAGGAFALFDPGQQTLLHDHIVAPEGRVYFAGEHASLAHAWIQGAIESGLHAAQEIHQRAGA